MECVRVKVSSSSSIDKKMECLLFQTAALLYSPHARCRSTTVDFLLLCEEYMRILHCMNSKGQQMLVVFIGDPGYELQYRSYQIS